MNLKATYLIEAALDAIKEDILCQVRHQAEATYVPCQKGTEQFCKLVKDYHRLREMIGKKYEVEPIPQMEYAEAMCEAMPARD